jgi:hypothetical protein
MCTVRLLETACGQTSMCVLAAVPLTDLHAWQVPQANARPSCFRSMPQDRCRANSLFNHQSAASPALARLAGGLLSAPC